MQKVPPTPKGFRDIQPDLAKVRREAIRKIEDVLSDSGFVPIETPTIEFADTLKGKYGDEEKLIYQFSDRGGRELALRYDLTVPLARFAASNQNLIAKGPFRRYQIGQVFRGENPQAGRYREFTQVDFDSVGSESFDEDAMIITAAIKAVRGLGLKNARMLINDRNNFQGIPIEAVRAIDKLHKIGEEGVKEELKAQNMADAKIEGYFTKIKESKETSALQNIFSVLQGNYQLRANRDFVFDPTLARGLDYYTGAIFELKPNDDPVSLSIGAGGRYDNLIGMFLAGGKQGVKRNIPAVGFSFGFDRLVDLL